MYINFVVVHLTEYILVTYISIYMRYMLIYTDVYIYVNIYQNLQHINSFHKSISKHVKPSGKTNKG